MNEAIKIMVGGDAPLVLEAALLVVACDPRDLNEVMPWTQSEKAIFSGLESFYFYTTCLRVQPSRMQDRTVILDPAICQQMQGHVHGFRNETAKQWGLDAANAQDTNIATTYQIVRAGARPSPAALHDQLTEFLDHPPSWWPFQPGQYELLEVQEDQPHGAHGKAANPLFTPYFNHFASTGLVAGLPWDWIDLQSENATLYVHGSTCFESVFHCWSYLQILEQSSRLAAALPARKDACIVIVGAGVSGLLCAAYLTSLGYTAVRLLERSARYGGKTHTLLAPDDLGTTVCELGTCYMSPAYDGMIEAFSSFQANGRTFDFTADNTRIEVGQGTERGIVVDAGSASDIMSFPDYGMMRACQWLGVAYDEFGRLAADAALAVAAEQYIRIRTEIFGSIDGVMPTTRPDGDPYGVLTRTFAEFLEANEMGVFMGYLEYAYQVQGYGDLNKIPAYYGMVWITPNIAWPLGKGAGVTGWSLGWENVWEQMVEKLGLDVRLNTDIVRIGRAGVTGACG